MIYKVKRAENLIINNPYMVDENETVENLIKISKELDVHSFLVSNIGKNKL